MGGIFKAISSIFKGVTNTVKGKKKSKTKQAPTPIAATAAKRSAALGSGYGTSGQTIMTSASGTENTASTGKTLLGG